MRYFLFLLLAFSFSGLKAQKVFSCKQDLFPLRHPEKKMFGYVDIFGNWKVRPYYDLGHNFYEGLAVVQKKSKYGVINCEGKVVLRVEYDEIKDFVNGYAWVRQGKLWGLVDYTGKVILENKYQEVKDISKFSDFAWLKTNDVWGVFDKEKMTFVHEPRFTEIQILNDKTSLISVNDKKGMLKHSDSALILEPIYESIKKFAPYLLEIEKDSKVGVVSDFGKKILSVNYDAVYDLDSGRFSVELNHKQALLTNRGRRLFGFIADSISTFKEGKSVLRRGDKYSFVNLSGKRLFGKTFNDANVFRKGEAIVKHNNNFHLISDKGLLSERFFDSLKYQEGYYVGTRLNGDDREKGEVAFLSNELDGIPDLSFHKKVYTGHASQIRVRTLEGKMRFLDILERAFPHPEDYDEISEWNENGYAQIRNGDKVGFIKNSLVVNVPVVYEKATCIDYNSSIYFKVKLKEDIGFKLLNSEGKEIISVLFDKVNYAGKNKFIIRNSETKFSSVVNHKGQTLLQPEYFELEYNEGSKSYIGLNSKGKRLLISSSGQILTKKYAGVTYLGYDRFSAWKKDKETVLNGKGDVVIPSSLLNYVSHEKKDLYTVSFNDSYALANKSGDLVTKYSYDKIYPFCSSYAVVKVGEKYGVINKKGRKVRDFVFPELKITQDNFILLSDNESVVLDLSGELK